MTVPKRLGKYEIQSILGKGAMGLVYKAFDPQIERTVAIKTVRKDIAEPELALQFTARFRNEARAAGRLNHPNIVGVYEYGEDDAVAFIAMEYVDGTGLGEYLNRKARFEFSQTCGIIGQLLRALEFAHDRGVVHRDIKPANLILTLQGVLKVADFGIARIDTSDLTMAGTVLGTPSYMSPEQCLGKPTDQRSDLFSAGVVLYELLTGQKPFIGTADTIMYQICNVEPLPPSQRAQGTLPQCVDALVARSLAKAPEARFQNARDFHQALQAAAYSVGATASAIRRDLARPRLRRSAAPAGAIVGQRRADNGGKAACTFCRTAGEGLRAQSGRAHQQLRRAVLDPCDQHRRSAGASALHRGIAWHRGGLEIRADRRACAQRWRRACP